MQNVLAVAVGGALGCVCRYAAAQACIRWFAAPVAYATFAVNIVGCFCLGVFAASTLGREALATTAVAVGFLGGLTTFSTFSLETIRLVQAGAVAGALVNVAASVVVGFGAVALGLQLGRSW